MLFMCKQKLIQFQPNPCQNGGTYTANICSCVFGCSGQYCQTCINGKSLFEAFLYVIKVHVCSFSHEAHERIVFFQQKNEAHGSHTYIRSLPGHQCPPLIVIYFQNSFALSNKLKARFPYFEGFSTATYTQLHSIHEFNISVTELFYPLFFLNLECSEASGVSGTGVAWIKPAGFDVPKQVWCNFDYGVTYIQNRKYGTVSFNRSYAEYENGFGDANGDYWLGNKYANILSLTRTFTCGFTLMKSSGSVMVYYYDFVVLDSNSNYALQYSSSSSSQYPLAQGQPFQAYNSGSACAITLGSGWWFGSTCSSGSLNGQYPVDFGAFLGATTTRIGIY